MTEREERVRSLIKLAHCDITTDPPIESGYEGPYNVVICFLILEVSCATIEEYRERAVRLSSLVKPGGTLLLLTTDRPKAGELGSYQLGSATFVDVSVSLEVVTEALKNASLEISSVDVISKRDKAWTGIGDSLNFALICAEKK